MGSIRAEGRKGVSLPLEGWKVSPKVLLWEQRGAGGNEGRWVHWARLCSGSLVWTVALLQHYILPPALLVVSWPRLTFWSSPLVLDISPIITSFIITCPLPPHTSPHKGLFTLTLLLRAGLEDPLGAWDQLML